MSNICTIVCKIVVYQHRRIFHFFTFLGLLLATNEKSRKVEKFMDNLLMYELSGGRGQRAQHWSFFIEVAQVPSQRTARGLRARGRNWPVILQWVTVLTEQNPRTKWALTCTYYFYTILALLSGAHPGQSTISQHPSVSLGMLQVNLLPFRGIVPSNPTRLYLRPETMFADARPSPQSRAQRCYKSNIGINGEMRWSMIFSSVVPPTQREVRLSIPMLRQGEICSPPTNRWATNGQLYWLFLSPQSCLPLWVRDTPPFKNPFVAPSHFVFFYRIIRPLFILFPTWQI